MSQTESLAAFARRLRVHVVKMTQKAQSSHVGGGLSMAEILAVLYGSVLRLRPDDPSWPGRDRFVLSKGHACAGLYAALAERGFFALDELETFYQDGSKLSGHVTHADVPGVECSTGSLGHGLPIACGMAYAGRIADPTFRVFVVLSDGECDEGSNWEAALFAAHHKLDNLTVIVDYNRSQSLGTTDEVLCLDPLPDKWQAFGWHAVEVNGHDIAELQSVLGCEPTDNRPTCVIANTVKGKGVSFMENQLLWHYRTPQSDEFERAIAELGASKPGSNDVVE